MKQMTCAQMGGPCNATMQAATPQAMADEGMKHLKAAHPDIYAQMSSMSEADSAKWMNDVMMPFWNSAPDMA